MKKINLTSHFGSSTAVRILKNLGLRDKKGNTILCKCGKKAVHELAFLSGTHFVCEDCNVLGKIPPDEMV